MSQVIHSLKFASVFFLDKEEEGSGIPSIFPDIQTTEATGEVVSVDMVTGGPPVLITQAFTGSEQRLGEIETHKPPSTTADILYVEQGVTQPSLSSPPSITDEFVSMVTAQPDLGLEIPDENTTAHEISLTGKIIIIIII